jgi:hypothetical protein
MRNGNSSAAVFFRRSCKHRVLRSFLNIPDLPESTGAARRRISSVVLQFMLRIPKSIRNPGSGDACDPDRYVEPEIAIGGLHHAAHTLEVGIRFAGNRVKFVAIEQRKSELSGRPDVIAAPSDRQHVPDM